jgi:hypothetical protein
MINMIGSKLSIFSHPGKITGYWITTTNTLCVVFLFSLSSLCVPFAVVLCTLCRRLVYPLLPDCPFVYFVIHIAVMILTYVIYNEMVSFPVKPQSTL